jgi:hypothetical protein
MVDVIFVGVFARRDQPKFSDRIASREVAYFAGGVAGGKQDEIGATAEAFNFDSEALVGFFEEK